LLLIVEHISISMQLCILIVLDELRNERVINPELLLRGSSPTLGPSDVIV
jgi:hypothetical protein